MHCDVAVIGGGPAGSTVGTLLRKYDPSLDVAIFEAEKFPRDHVGESQLPIVPRILDEMGVWDKVEAADFPIKIGASYRWGLVEDQDLWHFYFIPDGKFDKMPRPGKYAGQRALTAFQVDRSVYDKILLDHCREIGCRVYEETKVAKVVRDGDRIDHLVIRRNGSTNGLEETVTAKYFVDASGQSGIVRHTMGVEVESPTSLRNIAVWDYWQNAEWAEEIGVGGTMVQVMSFGWGWLWFIPLGPTRTSLGLITSAEYYKASGKTTEQLYLEAIEGEPRIRALVANAQRENTLRATKDWSFIADRMYGENWFLAGDVCGFADPILAAGMSLAHMGARRVAFSILELLGGNPDPQWIKDQFQRLHTKHIGNHIRFADYWYSVNAKFTDLKEYCSQIAKDAGFTLNAEDAFRWLGTGGFADEISGLPFAGTFRLGVVKELTAKFGGQPSDWSFLHNNIFELDLEGAKEDYVAVYEKGRVLKIPCYVRDGKTLSRYLIFGLVFDALRQEREVRRISPAIGHLARLAKFELSPELGRLCMEALEAMVSEGWVKASYDPSVPMLPEAMRARK